MESSIRVRFAPSPTGDLHIGGLRVALFNWLFARQHNGKYILRIEDTDQERYKPESVRSILEGLAWAGIDWDEGPYQDLSSSKFAVIEKGPHQSYFQSQRTAYYREHVNTLLEKGMAYRCFCTKERIEHVRAAQTAQKRPPMYDRHCRTLTDEEVVQKMEKKNSSVIRLKVPEKGKIEIHDLVRGAVSFDLSLVDDQVLLKSDSYPTYHLANVVDDHLMSITHVLRGEDWLSSLPKHLLLYQALGWGTPQFGHLPLILAADKIKLSKRHGAVSVLALRSLGYLPDALLNFTLLLGWNPGKGSEQEIFSRDEMVKLFTLEGIQRSPAICSIEKLNWMNSQYIRKRSSGDVAALALPHLLESGLLISLEGDTWMTADRRTVSRTFLERVMELARPRLVFPQDIKNEGEFFFDQPSYEPALLSWKHMEPGAVREYLLHVRTCIADNDAREPSLHEWESYIKDWIQKMGYGNGEVLWPLRIALTGKEKSPSPFEVLGVLGKDEALKRIDHAIEKLLTA